MRELLSNLGFILQFSGLFILLAAFVAIYLNETREAIAFFITSSTFLALGFPLNALSERKDLKNFKEALVLFVLTFLFLGLISSIPYLFLGLFSEKDLITNIVNSIFEGFSGITTTGFTFLNSENLSQSMIFYRALSQFIGGIGIVYLLITFIYSEKFKITRFFGKLIGFDENDEIKKNIKEIIIFYFSALAILSFLMFYFNKDLIKSFSLIASGIATGGFPHYDIASLSIEEKTLIIASMILGSISIFIIAKLKKELPLYIFLIFLTSLILYIYEGIDYFSSIFHAVSFVSTTGYSYIDIGNLSNQTLVILSIVMLIGGMAISTSGGFKIIRLIYFFKGMKDSIISFVRGSQTMIDEFVLISFACIFSYLIFLFLLSFILSYYYSDKDFPKIIFDASSSLTTSGFSSGLINDNLPILLKILIIFYMLLARIEILPIFALFVKIKYE